MSNTNFAVRASHVATLALIQSRLDAKVTEGLYGLVEDALSKLSELSRAEKTFILHSVPQLQAKDITIQATIKDRIDLINSYIYFANFTSR